MDRVGILEKIVHDDGICAVCGKFHPVSLKDIRMGAGALQELPQVINGLGNYGSVVMICDENTYIAAGKSLEKICPLTQTIILPAEHLHATETIVAYVESQLYAKCDLLLAVGSGTIHDITRYVAFSNELPFISVPTAASVDGYVSGLAAMTWHGAKRSFPAKPPIALVADIDVISRAPYALTVSGVGDLLGKYTALFDWRVAHMLTGEYICERIIDMEMQAIHEVTENLDRIMRQEKDAIEALTYGLVLSGLAMQMVGNSRPASGSEHHISHLIEMDVLIKGNDAYHGEKVGVCTAIVSEKYHEVLSKSLDKGGLSGYKALPEERIRQVFGEVANEIIPNENTPDPLLNIDVDVLIDKWQDIRTLAKETLPTGTEIRSLLRKCGGCAMLSDININEDMTAALCEFSPFVRRRLTFMRIMKLINA